jgi:hypothetical protein
MIHPFKYKQGKPLTPWRWSLLILTLFLKARRDKNAHPYRCQYFERRQDWLLCERGHDGWGGPAKNEKVQPLELNLKPPWMKKTSPARASFR